MTKQIKHIKLIFAAVFFIVVFLFWYIKYPFVLAYQEQLQMFLFDWNYLADRVVVPGGMARYVAEFITQFGSSPSYAATFFAVLFSLIQGLTWMVMKKDCKDGCWYVLSFLPALLLLVFMGDENFSDTFIVALIFPLLAMLAYPLRRQVLIRTAYVLLVTIILYWIAGPSVLIFAFYAMVKEVTFNRNYILPVILLVLPLACIYGSSYIVPYPLYRLFSGVNYYKVVVILPLMQAVIMSLLAIISSFVSFLPAFDNRTKHVTVVVAQVVIVAMIIGRFFPMFYSLGKLDVMEYDNLVRQQKWDAIIAKAQKKAPDTPLTVASLNLALAMKGHLLDQAFNFYQHGWEGAFPVYDKSYQVSIMSAEIYYYLGLVNTAQRLDFEGMEAIPDNNKSGRLVRRLAETNLINGQYAVAQKYIDILKKTLVYSGWAKDVEKLLGNETAIDNNPVYGYLRKMRLANDFLFSDQELDKEMGQLVMRDRKNMMAIQYLLFLPQLQGDRRKYEMYKNYVESILKEKAK